VTVLPASSLDAPARAHLVALVNAAFATHAWLFPGGERTDDETFREETAGADLLLLHDSAGPDPTAPTAPGVPVAMAMIRPDDRWPGALYLGMVAVRPTAQRRGYGAALVRAAEDEARRRGLLRVTLGTVPELGNTAYYERKGYVVVSRDPKPAGTWGSSAPFTLLRMEKDLSAARTAPPRC